MPPYMPMGLHGWPPATGTVCTASGSFRRWSHNEEMGHYGGLQSFTDCPHFLFMLASWLCCSVTSSLHFLLTCASTLDWFFSSSHLNSFLLLLRCSLSDILSQHCKQYHIRLSKVFALGSVWMICILIGPNYDICIIFLNLSVTWLS